MDTYCVSCKKNTVNKNSNVTRTKQNRLMLVLIVFFEVIKTKTLL